MTGWTDERTETAKRLFKEGFSGAQIAEHLNRTTRSGFSRNAVIGKLHRLGLTGGAVRSTRAAQESSAIKRRSTPVSTPWAPRPQDRKPPEPVAMPDEGPGLATPETLGPHMCKWPIGDPLEPGFTYCGRPAEGSYCAAHDSVAFKPRDPAKDKKLAGMVRRLAA